MKRFRKDFRKAMDKLDGSLLYTKKFVILNSDGDDCGEFEGELQNSAPEGLGRCVKLDGACWVLVGIS